MTTLIEQTVLFDAPAHDVYEAIMDSARHAAFTNSAAEISREVGGGFMAYNGYIHGVNLELLADRKIVQSWRAVDWPEDYFSVVTFLFTEQDGCTRLDFSHADVPDGTQDEFNQGWIENYWEPLKAFLKA